MIVLQNHDSLQLGHFSYWGFGGKEADFLSECGSFVILSGKVWGVGWGLSTAASLSQVGREVDVPGWEPVGAAFSTLGSFKEHRVGCLPWAEESRTGWLSPVGASNCVSVVSHVVL